MINKATFPKRLAGGYYIDLGNFTEDDVDLEDINTALNQIKRFGGHYKDKPPLTVAQHSWLVKHLAEQCFPEESSVHFNALIHDFPETYYGDIVTPIKHRLKKSPIFRDFIDMIDKAVYDKLWKPQYTLDDDVADKTRFCDLLALDIERRSMWKSQHGKDMWPEIPDIGMSLEEKQELFKTAQGEGAVIDLVLYYKGF